MASHGTQRSATYSPPATHKAANCRATRASPGRLDRPFARAMMAAMLSLIINTR